MHRTEWRRSLIDTAVESRSWLTGLVLHRVWRTCGRWMGERKTRAIALAGDSTMTSWEICTMSRAMNYPQATGIRPKDGSTNVCAVCGRVEPRWRHSRRGSKPATSAWLPKQRAPAINPTRVPESLWLHGVALSVAVLPMRLWLVVAQRPRGRCGPATGELSPLPYSTSSCWSRPCCCGRPTAPQGRRCV